MTVYSWIGGDGDFGDADSWSPAFNGYYAFYPDDVSFDGTNKYTVTYNDSEYPDIGVTEISISDPNATFSFFDPNGGDGFTMRTLTMSAGTFLIDSEWAGRAYVFSSTTEFTGGTINISDYGVFNAGNITIGSNSAVNGTQGVPILTGALTNNGTIASVGSNHTVFTIGADSITNDGLIKSAENDSMVISTDISENLNNNGVVSSQTLNLINSGTIWADGGSIVLSNANYGVEVSGTGTIEISDAGSFSSYGGAFLRENITFEGAGTLIVSSSVNTDVIGFAAGDSIDYSGLTYASGDHLVWQSTSNGVESFALETSTGSVLTSLNFSGHYSNASFQAANDGSNGVRVLSTGLTISPLSNDFNGDCVSDIFLQNGAIAVDWTIQNNSISNAQAFGVGSGYSVVATGDFYGAGTSDVLYENSSGQLVDWKMTGGQPAGGGFLGTVGSGWEVAGTGRFNGGQTSDILFENAIAGGVVIWSLTSGAVTGQNYYSVGAGYNVVGTGDFNGDGTTDILFENGAGSVVEWLMHNGSIASSAAFSVASGWNVVGTGDFNGDGTSDILFQNSGSGEIVDWTMKSGSISSTHDLGNANGYAVAGTGDFYGTGTSDILLKGDGSLVDWTINNSTVTKVGVLAQLNSGWTIF